MLGRPKNPPSNPARPGSQDTPEESTRQYRHTLRTLHSDMLSADDTKIRQIVSLLDESPQHHVVHAVLDKIRPRLAALRPVRPLRFTRLLFIPFMDLLVPAGDWKPGHASVPRSILKPISDIVETALGRDADAIHSMIAGHDTNALDVVAQAGALLWPRAGEILAPAPLPEGWTHTGLPDTAYPPLARALATVLRRAVPLRWLQRETELGMLQSNQQIIDQILSDMVSEPVEGRLLVFKLLIEHFPRPSMLVQRLSGLTDTPAERALLQAAMAAGVDDFLSGAEAAADIVGTLSDVSTHVQRLTTLLQDLSNDAEAPRHRARLRVIREKMDVLCRDRFAEGMQEGLVSPLAATASAPVDADGQKQLERCARDLRSVETVGRKLGSPAAYDALLGQAGAKVEAAVDTGVLSPMRAVRLVEILAGPDEAEKLYNRKRSHAAHLPPTIALS